jgi:hypothetical protein
MFLIKIRCRLKVVLIALWGVVLWAAVTRLCENSGYSNSAVWAFLAIWLSWLYLIVKLEIQKLISW